MFIKFDNCRKLGYILCIKFGCGNGIFMMILFLNYLIFLDIVRLFIVVGVMCVLIGLFISVIVVGV